MLTENNLDILLFHTKYLKQKDYWMGKLSNPGETTDILKSNKPYMIDNFKIDTPTLSKKENCEIYFDDDLSRKIINTCKFSELALYIFLVSALKALIYRYSNYKNIIIFSPVYEMKATEETLNNQVLICQDIEGALTFKEVLLNVKNTVLEAYENQDYPYEKLEEIFFPSTPPSHISCWLENIHCKADIEKIKAGLSFGFSLEGEKITGRIFYNRNFYREIEIRRLANHIILLLNSISENLAARIETLEFLSKEEKKQLLNDFNNNHVDFSNDKTLPRRFEEQVEKMPDSTAIACEDQQITYYELNQGANQLAFRLKKYNLQKEQLVVILFHRSLFMIESLLATWKAGAAYIPLDINDPVQRLQGILADSASPILICQTQLLASQLEKTFNGKILLTDELQKKAHHDKEKNGIDLNLSIEPGSLAYVIYTSGSTGKPKGAMVNHIGMMNHILAKIHDLQITSKSIVAQNASHVFDISVWQFFTALVKGGKTIIYPGKIILDPYRFISRLIRDQVTILEVVPSYLAVMLEFLDNNSFQFYSLRYLLVTGETMKPGLVKQWYDKYSTVKIVNAYGPTEASDDITHFFIEKALDTEPEEWGERIPIGKPIRNLTIYILDEYLHLCPLEVTGEICVSGIGVGRGYLNNPELTADRFIKNNNSDGSYMTHILYKTGDLGRWLSDGAIEFFGRKDYQVKIRGFRIELEEIERCLAAYPGIKEAVVIIKTIATPYLCAYLVTSSGEKPDIQAIKKYLDQHLPIHMVPDNFVQLERMPLTANGKIDRKALSVLDDSIAVKKEHTLPSSRLEKKLVQVWADILAIEPSVIGIDDNFFELGGHSLKATILTARIHKELDVKIPLAEIFKTPTIKGLSTYINSVNDTYNVETNKYISLDEAEKKEYYPFSLTQKRFYILQILNPGATNYNLPLILVMEGYLEKKKLEETFMKLIKRHESLRTSFELIDGQLVQRIQDRVEIAIELYEVPQGKEKKIIQDFVRPFSLDKAPLLRVGLIKTGETMYILMIDMHHIITDGLSSVILSREFTELYDGKELPQLRLQYTDFSEWQHSEKEKERLKRQGEFWLKKFENEIPLLTLRTDYPRPSVQSFEGNDIYFEIGIDETATLDLLATQEGVSLFMILFSIYNILLWKLSGQSDIIIGTGVLSRNHADLMNIIGLFFNTIPLQNHIEGQISFRKFLNDVKEKTLNAFENQEYPIDMLVENLLNLGLLTRDPGRNPLFDTMFALQNFWERPTAATRTGLTGLSIKPYVFEKKTSRFDLFLEGTQRKETIHMRLEYSTILFKHSTAQKITGYYMDILKQVLENKEIKLKEISISNNLLDVKAIGDQKEYMDFGF